MKTGTVTLAYFSPTGTTKKVLGGIAETVGADDIRHIDLTLSDTMSNDFPEIKEGLVLLGVPVYGGRVPPVAVERLMKLKGSNIPAAVIVVYGNREYEDSLLELRDIAVSRGFKPIAGGAFIGEHSFTDETTPVAVGRPDVQDMGAARDLGRKIAEKMKETANPDDIGELSVPGNVPMRERHRMDNIPPETDIELCIMCQACVGICPTAAITFTDEVITDADSCIFCCACIKYCPAGARRIDNPKVEKIRRWLNEACRERKEPVYFLG